MNLCQASHGYRGKTINAKHKPTHPPHSYRHRSTSGRVQVAWSGIRGYLKRERTVWRGYRLPRILPLVGVVGEVAACITVGVAHLAPAGHLRDRHEARDCSHRHDHHHRPPLLTPARGATTVHCSLPDVQECLERLVILHMSSIGVLKFVEVSMTGEISCVSGQ